MIPIRSRSAFPAMWPRMARVMVEKVVAASHVFVSPRLLLPLSAHESRANIGQNND